MLIIVTYQDVSVNRFFERPDKEKQFLYRLLLEEDNVEFAMENFKNCLRLIHSKESYDELIKSGFNVIERDENRTIEETLALVGELLTLNR